MEESNKVSGIGEMAAMGNVSVTFTSIYTYFQTSMLQATSSYGSGLLSLVIAPLAVAATIYFLLLGYGILRGAIQMPIRELAWQVGKVGMVFAACTATFYSAVVVSGVPAIATTIIAAGSGSSTTNPGSTFDTYMTSAFALISDIDQADNQVDVAHQGDTFAPMTTLNSDIVDVVFDLVVALFAFASAIVGFCITLFALLGVQICVALAPLAFASLIFNSSRWFFDGWMRQTINYSLLMVIISIVVSMITGMEKSILTSLIGQIANPQSFITGTGGQIALNNGAIVAATLAIGVIYTVGTIFFFETPKIASGIAGGTASGGQGFLQSTGNAVANRMIARMGGGRGGGGGGGGSGGGSGGSVSRGS